MNIEKDGSLTITENQEGIGQSLLSDFSDMLGVNISNPGVFSAGYKFNKLIETSTDKTFTATAAVDLITVSATLWNNGVVTGTPVLLSTDGTLPAPLVAGTVYYVIAVGTSTTNYKLAETLKLALAGTAINITDAGTGTHTITPVTPEEVKGYTFDSNNNLYLLDGEQRVWFTQPTTNYQNFYLLAGNTSSGAGNGIVFYAGYILVFANAKIDALLAINATSDTLTWTNDFASASSTISTAVYPSKGACPFYSQYDNAVYFSNGTSTTNTSLTRVGLLEEVVGETFLPTDTSTFSVVSDAIELSNSDGKGFVQSINEVGDKLILGTQSNNVYFWDRKSILPYSVVNMPEQNTSAILVRAGAIYAFNGYSGRIYPIAESSYGEPISIPSHLFDTRYTESTSYSSLLFIDFVDANFLKDELLFSIEVSGKCYLMSYNVRTKTLIKKSISSYGETLTTGSQPGRIYKIIPLDKNNILRDNILISTKKEASPDTLAIEGYYSGADLKVLDDDSAYFTTGLTSVGDVYSKKTVRELQVSFTRALTTGQGVKVYYRLDDNSAFTLLKTIDYTTNGPIKDLKIPAPITDIIDLQIKVVINGYNSTSYGTSPFLKLVRLIP